MSSEAIIYLFDGSLEGLLCAVFESFERKQTKVNLQLSKHYQPDAFSETFQVHNNAEKAGRVWRGLQQRLSPRWMRKFYCCFLSERPLAFTSLFEFCHYLFTQAPGAESNYGNPHVLFTAQMARKVEREKHRMEAFIRFQETEDRLFYCGIDPDFNVLPLIMKHFKDRYSSQQWLIYDINRNYGLFYDLLTVEEVHMDFEAQKKISRIPADSQAPKEQLYEQLWKDYFKSTNIKARKNTKLHVQHVPKRYWKYLTEKQID